jgi:hypothetical protein
LIPNTILCPELHLSSLLGRREKKNTSLRTLMYSTLMFLPPQLEPIASTSGWFCCGDMVFIFTMIQI